MVTAADYPFLDIVGTMIVFFAWVAWIWLLVSIFADIFRRHDIGGWAKAGWVALTFLLPFLGVLIYLIAQGKHMAERNVKEVQASRAAFDDYVRTVAAESGPSDQIGKAKQLLDSGAISQAEFDQIKQKALTV